MLWPLGYVYTYQGQLSPPRISNNQAPAWKLFEIIVVKRERNQLSTEFAGASARLYRIQNPKYPSQSYQASSDLESGEREFYQKSEFSRIQTVSLLGIWT